MKAFSVDRSSLAELPLAGVVLTRDLRDAGGRVAVAKGHIVREEDLPLLRELDWDALHVIRLDPGDVHEHGAGERLARAAVGDGVDVGQLGGGHWPLVSSRRGVLTVRQECLAAVNRLDGTAVYTVFDGQVVNAGETVARAKIIPFVVEGAVIERAVSLCGQAAGLVAVRPFVPLPVGAVVQESLGDRAADRFREAFGEKVAWFGCPLVAPRFVPASADLIAAALTGVIESGARVVAVAGSRPMDPLDPAFEALRRLGAPLVRQGVPAHPGSLLWLARAGEIPIVGMPSCGLFSQATVFDLVLTRLLAGDPVDGEWLAGLGHGGFLTRDMAFRFPPYRASRNRGEVV